MELIKRAYGVEYRRRQNHGDPTRYVYEGGPMGGTIFVNKSTGQYGSATDWHDKFEDAAFIRIQNNQASYLRHKKAVDEYEQQSTNDGKHIE